MKRHIIYIYALAALLLAGCGSSNPKATVLLQQADSLMDAQPDSALHLLESHQMVKDAWPRPLRMRWELLRAKAMNKAYVPFTTDSVMLQVASYYDGGDPNDAMLAHYLLGCVYRDLGEAPMALQFFHKAVEAADTKDARCDFSTLSRIYGQIADLFSAHALWRESIKANSLGSRFAIEGGDTLASYIFFSSMASGYYNLGNEDSTLLICQQAAQMLEDYGDTLRANQCLAPAIMVYANRHDYDNMEKCLANYEHHSMVTLPESTWNENYYLLYYYKGLYYMHLLKLDSAEASFRRLTEKNRSLNNKGLGTHGLYSLYKQKNYSDSAIHYGERYVELHDSMVRCIEDEMLQRQQSFYNYSRHQQMALKQSEKARIAHMLLTIVVSFLIILTLAFVAFYWRSRARKNQFEKRLLEYQQMLERRQASSVQRQNDPVVERFNTLLESKLRKSLVDRIAKGGSEWVKATDEEWMQIEHEVNEAFPNFNNQLANYLPHLNQVYYRICLGIKFGLEPGQIAILVSRSKQAVSSARSRMYRKAFGKDGTTDDFDQFIDSF
jgi:tetratricopeptide (TPR) repeat protein